MFTCCSSSICNVSIHVLILQDVVDQEMSVELYQQKTFMDLGVSAPLAYQDLIDNGFFALKKPDSDISRCEISCIDFNEKC